MERDWWVGPERGGERIMITRVERKRKEKKKSGKIDGNTERDEEKNP